LENPSSLEREEARELYILGCCSFRVLSQTLKFFVQLSFRKVGVYTKEASKPFFCLKRGSKKTLIFGQLLLLSSISPKIKVFAAPFFKKGRS